MKLAYFNNCRFLFSRKGEERDSNTLTIMALGKKHFSFTSCKGYMTFYLLLTAYEAILFRAVVLFSD